MTIRQYEDADEAPVIALWHACGLTTPQNDPAREIHAKQRVQPDLFLVGEDNGRIVATVMSGFDGHRGWLYSLAVAPDCRRRSFGRQIVAEAETRLKALGCWKVNLQIRAANSDVVAFYERLGFAVEDRISLGKRL